MSSDHSINRHIDLYPAYSTLRAWEAQKQCAWPGRRSNAVEPPSNRSHEKHTNRPMGEINASRTTMIQTQVNGIFEPSPPGTPVCVTSRARLIAEGDSEERKESLRVRGQRPYCLRSRANFALTNEAAGKESRKPPREDSRTREEECVIRDDEGGLEGQLGSPYPPIVDWPLPLDGGEGLKGRWGWSPPPVAECVARATKTRNGVKYRRPPPADRLRSWEKREKPLRQSGLSSSPPIGRTCYPETQLIKPCHAQLRQPGLSPSPPICRTCSPETQLIEPCPAQPLWDAQGISLMECVFGESLGSLSHFQLARVTDTWGGERFPEHFEWEFGTFGC